MKNFEQFVEATKSPLIGTKWKFITGDRLFKGQTLEQGDIVVLDKIDKNGVGFFIPTKRDWDLPSIGQLITPSKYPYKTGDFVVFVTSCENFEVGDRGFLGFNTDLAEHIVPLDTIPDDVQDNIEINTDTILGNPGYIGVHPYQVIDVNQRDCENVYPYMIRPIKTAPQQLIDARQDWLRRILSHFQTDKYILSPDSFKQHFKRVQ